MSTAPNVPTYETHPDLYVHACKHCCVPVGEHHRASCPHTGCLRAVDQGTPRVELQQSRPFLRAPAAENKRRKP